MPLCGQPIGLHEQYEHSESARERERGGGESPRTWVIPAPVKSQTLTSQDECTSGCVSVTQGLPPSASDMNGQQVSTILSTTLADESGHLVLLINASACGME